MFDFLENVTYRGYVETPFLTFHGRWHNSRNNYGRNVLQAITGAYFLHYSTQQNRPISFNIAYLFMTKYHIITTTMASQWTSVRLSLGWWLTESLRWKTFWHWGGWPPSCSAVVEYLLWLRTFHSILVLLPPATTWPLTSELVLWMRWMGTLKVHGDISRRGNYGFCHCT